MTSGADGTKGVSVLLLMISASNDAWSKACGLLISLDQSTLVEEAALLGPNAPAFAWAC
jgi:hypothetical protein